MYSNGLLFWILEVSSHRISFFNIQGVNYVLSFSESPSFNSQIAFDSPFNGLFAIFMVKESVNDINLKTN